MQPTEDALVKVGFSELDPLPHVGLQLLKAIRGSLFEISYRDSLLAP